jgi:hypothetical protein
MKIRIIPKDQGFLIHADELPILECSDIAVAVKTVIDANRRLAAVSLCEGEDLTEADHSIES